MACYRIPMDRVNEPRSGTPSGYAAAASRPVYANPDRMAEASADTTQDDGVSCHPVRYLRVRPQAGDEAAPPVLGNSPASGEGPPPAGGDGPPARGGRRPGWVATGAGAVSPEGSGRTVHEPDGNG